MNDLEQQIQDAAGRNQHLLGVLKQTDHAVPGLRQQERYISDLEGQLAKTKSDFAVTSQQRGRDLKNHNKYKDSTFRRFAYKLGGKKDAFAEKADQGEKDYFATLQREQELKDQREELERLLTEAKAACEQLRLEAATHQDAQRQLDALYDSIFSGPTPRFPEEDDKEREADHALQVYHDVRTRFETEQKAAEHLRAAEQALRAALASMASALSCSRMDMFGGGTFTDMMERNNLSEAQRRFHAAAMRVEQARSLSPQLPPLPHVEVAAGSIMSDVFFDNIFTDMAFHEKIQRSNAEMRQSATALSQMSAQCSNRINQLRSELTQEEARLEASRQALQDVRASVFTRLGQTV